MKLAALYSFVALSCGLLACQSKPPPPQPSPSAAAALTADEALAVATPVKVEPAPWAGRSTEAAGFPCDVDRVLAASCRRCHWEPQENDAPFAMTSWEALQEKRDGKPIFVLMKQMVEADLMPPTDALVKPRPEPLSAEQKSTLLAWLSQGALRASDTCGKPD